MQNNNFNNSSPKIDYMSFLEITTNVLGKSILEDFVKGIRNKKLELLKKSNEVESNELNSKQFKEDVRKKTEEMNLVFKENSNFRDFASQEKMHGLMQETTKILDDFEKVRIKNEMIEKKISEKKVFLKLNGGFNLNPMLGDEIGNLLIESMKNKLNLLKKYQE